MASLQDRLRQQIKERKAKKVKSDLNNEVMKAEKQNKKNAGLKVYGKINKTTEKKLKKKGLSDAEIKKFKKKDVDNKGSFGAKAKNKRTYFRDDKPTASKSKSKLAPKAVDKGGRLSARGSEGYKPTKTNMGPDMSKVNKPAKARAKKVDLKKRGPSGPTMTSMGAPSTGPKPRNKDPKVDLKKRGPSGPSMTGFKHGGKVRGDGVCRKGKTKGRMV
jgi:hypothetical protein